MATSKKITLSARTTAHQPAKQAAAHASKMVTTKKKSLPDSVAAALNKPLFAKTAPTPVKAKTPLAPKTSAAKPKAAAVPPKSTSSTAGRSAAQVKPVKTSAKKASSANTLSKITKAKAASPLAKAAPPITKTVKAASAKASSKVSSTKAKPAAAPNKVIKGKSAIASKVAPTKALPRKTVAKPSALVAKVAQPAAKIAKPVAKKSAVKVKGNSPKAPLKTAVESSPLAVSKSAKTTPVNKAASSDKQAKSAPAVAAAPTEIKSKVSSPKPAPASSSAKPRTGKAALPVSAAMLQTQDASAAKASYITSPAPVNLSPIAYTVIKKNPRLAQNWKNKPVTELTDEEVIAMPDDEYMNATQLSFFKLRLTQLKDNILSNAGMTTEHLRDDTSVVPDPTDRATIEEEHALELRTRDRERKLLKKIEQSIARIDAGDYGYCDETGEPIGIGRLLARPTATLSLEAQQRRELKQKLYGE